MELLNEIIGFIRADWLTLVLAAFLAAMLSYGWKKGLARMSFSLTSFIVTAVLSKGLMPYIVLFLEKNDSLTIWFRKIIESYLSSQAAGGRELNDARIYMLYSILGLDRLADKAAWQLCTLLLSLIVFIVLLIFSRIILKMIFGILDRVMELPVLKLINKSCGALVGIFEGLLYIWIFIMILGLFPDNDFSLEIMKQFNRAGTFPYYIKEGNMIIYFLSMMGGRL